jgi:type II secretory pathway pseudopilin PulG
MRADDGFGLIELLIAMMVLTIAIMAIFAGFTSGMLALQRSGHASTAATMADIEMEKYRRFAFDQVPPVKPSTADYSTSFLRDKTTTPVSPDGHAYFVKVDAKFSCVVGSPPPPPAGLYPQTCATSPASRAVKLVSIVVRDKTATGNVLIRETSTFDAATG